MFSSFSKEKQRGGDGGLGWKGQTLTESQLCFNFTTLKALAHEAGWGNYTKKGKKKKETGHTFPDTVTNITETKGKCERMQSGSQTI